MMGASDQVHSRTHGLLGWVASSARDGATAVTETMQNAFATNLPVAAKNTAHWACAATGGIQETANGGCVAIIGQPYWKAEQLRKLAREQSHAAALAAAYSQEGDTCLEKLAGAFSCAIVDPQTRQTLVYVDRMGRFPLYYTTAGNELVFSTSLNCVASHPLVKREICPQGIYNYVYFHMLPSPASIFKDIKKLHAGSRLVYEQGEVSVERYWQPRFEELTDQRFVAQKNKLRHALTNAVQHAISDDRQVGAFLSGGLDSSTVVGILSEVQGPEAQAFSIGFSADHMH